MKTDLRRWCTLTGLLISLTGCDDREPTPLKPYTSGQADAYVFTPADAFVTDAMPEPDMEVPDFEVPVVACDGEEAGDLCPLLHRCIAGTCQPDLGGHYRLTGLAVNEPAGAASLLTLAFRATLTQGDLLLILESDGYLENGDYRWYVGNAGTAPILRDGCPTGDSFSDKYVYKHDQPIFPIEGRWHTDALRPPPDAGVGDPPDAEVAEPDPLIDGCTPTGLRFVQNPIDDINFTLTYPSGDPVTVPDESECAPEGATRSAPCFSKLGVEARFEITPCLPPERAGAEALLAPEGPVLRGSLNGVLPENEVRRLNIIVGGIQQNLASLLASQGVLPTVDTNADGASDAYPFEFEFLAEPTVFIDDNDERVLRPERPADELCEARP